MKTLIAIITLGTITLTPASAGDCHDGRSPYGSSGYNTRFYAPRPQYVPNYNYNYQPRYTDRHHSYTAPSYNNHGHREDSHGHRVDKHGHHGK